MVDVDVDVLAERIGRLDPVSRRGLLRSLTPRVTPGACPQVPFVKQEVFMLASQQPGCELLYGGSVAGGKSSVALLAASMYWDVPGYACVIFRKSWPDLTAPGAILDRAKQWWGNHPSVVMRESGRVFEWVGGGKITFAHMAREANKYSHQGAEYQCVIWDELTQFKEDQYLYLSSRLRKPQVPCRNCNGVLVKQGGWVHWDAGRDEVLGTVCVPRPDENVLDNYPGAASDGLTLMDVPLRMLATSNPGGVGHVWVRDRFIDPKTKNPDAHFLSASLDDNPTINKEAYLRKLEKLDPVTYRQLVNGDWFATPEGEMFKRDWFGVVDDSPVPVRGCRWVRSWDEAATKGDGDFTVGVLMCRLPDGRLVVEDMVRGQWDSAVKERIILQTALLDGRDVEVVFEQEPGSAGKDRVVRYERLLEGFVVHANRPTGDKVTRAKPWSAACGQGIVSLVKAPWNRDFLDEHLLFPQQVMSKSSSPDIVDAVSQAHLFLTNGRMGKVLVDSRDNVVSSMGYGNWWY